MALIVNDEKKISSFIRILIATGLLIFLVNRVGLSKIVQEFKGIELFFFFVLFGLRIADSFLRALNWMLVLKAKNLVFSISDLLYSHIVGTFFGTFIPSSLGTDVSRALLLSSSKSIRAADSALSMLFLNMINLLALCVFGLSSFVILEKMGINREVAWMIGAISCVFIVLFALLLRGWSPIHLKWNLQILRKILEKLNGFAIALKEFKGSRISLLRNLLVSIANQMIAVITIFAVSRSLHIEVPFWQIFALVPAISLSRLIPLSIAGLGAEQGIFIYLFSELGVLPAEALSMSLILSLFNLFFVLLGGLLYLVNSFKKAILVP